MGLNLSALNQMSRDERVAFEKRADAAFAEILADHAKQARAGAKSNRRSAGRRQRPGDTLICLPMVIHERNRGGVVASTDGNEHKRVFLPFAAGVEVYFTSGPKWAAITMPKWLRNNRKLHTYNRSELQPARPGFLVGHPDYEAYQLTEDCDRTNIDQWVRRRNAELSPGKSFERKSYCGSQW